MVATWDPAALVTWLTACYLNWVEDKAGRLSAYSYLNEPPRDTSNLEVWPQKQQGSIIRSL